VDLLLVVGVACEERVLFGYSGKIPPSAGQLVEYLVVNLLKTLKY
jgi:hypothetical protein